MVTLLSLGEEVEAMVSNSHMSEEVDESSASMSTEDY